MKEIKSLNKGECKYCGAAIYWTRTEKNNRPIPVECRITKIINKFGEVEHGHEPHHAYCTNLPDKEKN